MSSTIASYREVTDANGRVYRIGETDRQLLGRSRAWMVWLPWIAMMAISVFEYAYGSAEDTLSHAHGWTQSEAADALGCSVSTLRNHLDRGLRRLRAALGGEDA